MYRNTNNTMYCVYDLAIAPITFDFMHFAVISEMARAANKFDYVHFVFTLNAERQWRMHTPKDKALSVEDKMLYATQRNIMFMLCLTFISSAM